MKNCEYFEALISGLIDGEITQAEKDELFAHLETCENCRNLYENYKVIFSHTDPVTPPKELLENVMAQIKQEPEMAETPEDLERPETLEMTEKPENPKHRYYIRYISAAAACFAAVFIAWQSGLLPHENSSSNVAEPAENLTVSQDEMSKAETKDELAAPENYSDSLQSSGTEDYESDVEDEPSVGPSLVAGSGNAADTNGMDLESLGISGYDEGLYLIYIEDTLPDFLNSYTQQTLETGFVLIFPDQADIEKLDEYPIWDLSVDSSAKTAVLFKAES